MAEEEKKTEHVNPEPADESEQPATPHKEDKPPAESRLGRFKAWYLERKKWTIPVSVLAFLLILGGTPFTRYQLAGLALKRDFSIRLLDSTSHTPVSGATVTIGGKSAESDGSGKVTLHVKVGDQKFSISKKYYAPGDANLLVPILKQKQVPDIEMSATGRQVKVTVKNLISRSVLAGVKIDVAGTSAKTDNNGAATLVLPAGISEQKATLSLDGFNDSNVNVKVSSDKVQENDFSLTPAGKVYFLSKLSGKIDVVKTNLDGSDRQTVLAGTGKEDDSGTVLLASRDWKYLALLSRRAGTTNPSLYLIDTSNDNLSNIDTGNASFNLVGWSDDNFVYYVTRANVQAWQPHGQALKSFNANTKQLLTLDQTEGQGTDQYNYAQERYGSIYEVGSTVVYEKTWSNYYAVLLNGDPVTGKLKSGIYTININGSNHQTLKTFDNTLGWYLSINSLPDTPTQIYYQVTDPYQASLHGDGSSYYVYANGKLSSKPSVANEFAEYQSPKTYLLAPSGNNSFWSESRDGKNTLLLGDESGQNGKQIATLSDYNTYGWFTDNYLLVSKNSSELYVMSKDGKNVIKITDYHKPALTYPGYGGGYGGL